MRMPSVQTRTMFRMPPLQSCAHSSSDGYRSFKTQRPRVQGPYGRGTRGFWNSFEQWSSHTRQCDKLAIHGCSSTSSKGVSVGQSPPEVLQKNVVVRGLEKTSEYFDTTNFFLDELIEAKSTIEKLEESENSFPPWQDEDTSQLKEDEGTGSHSDVWQDSESSGLGKLSLESNGPPMVILQAYLKADNSQQQEKEKLRQLPLPMPHKVRHAGHPRVSLRCRLGIAYSRKSVVPAGQESDSIGRHLAVDIRALPPRWV